MFSGDHPLHSTHQWDLATASEHNDSKSPTSLTGPKFRQAKLVCCTTCSWEHGASTYVSSESGAQMMLTHRGSRATLQNIISSFVVTKMLFNLSKNSFILQSLCITGYASFREFTDDLTGWRKTPDSYFDSNLRIYILDHSDTIGNPPKGLKKSFDNPEVQIQCMRVVSINLLTGICSAHADSPETG